MQRREPNVISFKVNSHCAFASGALILCVLDLAKGGDVIAESVLLLDRLGDTNPSHPRRARGKKPILAPWLGAAKERPRCRQSSRPSASAKV